MLETEQSFDSFNVFHKVEELYTGIRRKGEVLFVLFFPCGKGLCFLKYLD